MALTTVKWLRKIWILYNHPLMAIDDPLDQNNPAGSDQTVWLLKNPLLRDEFEFTNSDLGWTELFIS